MSPAMQEGFAGRAWWGVRWGARVLSGVLVLMVLAFLVGEGVAFHRLSPVEWAGMAGLGALCAGLLLGWRHERSGGLLALSGLAVLTAIEIATNGHPMRGGVWWLFGLPAVLYLLSALHRRRMHSSGP